MNEHPATQAPPTHVHIVNISKRLTVYFSTVENGWSEEAPNRFGESYEFTMPMSRFPGGVHMDANTSVAANMKRNQRRNTI